MNQAEAIAAAQKLGPEWKWVAMEHNGDWYAYMDQPVYVKEWASWYLHDKNEERMRKLYKGWLSPDSLAEVPQ